MANQSQYAQETDLISLSITQAAGQRFGSIAITAALQAASSIADSYLASQFVLPLQTSPRGWDMSLTLATCNIAAYLLYVQFGFNPNSPVDKLIESRYLAAIEWLKTISEKKVEPQWTDSSGSTGTSPAAGPFVISDAPVGFTSRGLPFGDADPWSDS